LPESNNKKNNKTKCYSEDIKSKDLYSNKTKPSQNKENSQNTKATNKNKTCQQPKQSKENKTLSHQKAPKQAKKPKSAN
jgi:hypothetical protein